MVKIVEDLNALSPSSGVRPFVRISGSIGDPGKNPDTWMPMSRMNELHMPWGITLDGLAIPVKMMNEMFSPASFMQWAHVSLDAGSNKTYVELKKNKPYVPPSRPNVIGPFDVVIMNIERMVKQRQAAESSAKIVVSVVVQNENYPEVEGLAHRLKAMGVDVFQIKMQHFDERRIMPRSTVRAFYRQILPKIKDLADKRFMVEVLPPDEESAHFKNEGQLIQIIKKTGRAVLASPIDFHRCWVGLWSRTLTPDGFLNRCCQVHSEILPPDGNIYDTPLKDIWESAQNALNSTLDPRGTCRECAPQDLFMNRLISFLHEAATLNPLLIKEFKRTLFHFWEIEMHRRGERRPYESPGTVARPDDEDLNPPGKGRSELPPEWWKPPNRRRPK
jgi:hypothetical protein